MAVVVTNRVGELLAKKQREEGRMITHQQLAEEVGVTQNTVTAWVRNRVTRFDADTLMRFCWYFGVTPNELLVVPEKPQD